MVNINRSGHAEWYFQTHCKVCFLISVSAPTPIGTQHDHSWQNTHITWYIKVTVNIPGKGITITLYTTHWHFQKCYCYLCLLMTLMHPDLSLWVLHAQVDPTCMVTLGLWWSIPDQCFTQRSTCHPQWLVQDTIRHKDSIQTQCPPLDSACMCQKPLGKGTNHQEKY